MEYLRKVDFSAFDPDRFSYQVLAETESCIIVLVRQPANGDARGPTPHYHVGDQIFYVLEGGLQIEIDGVSHRVEAESAIFIPAGALHGHVPYKDEMHLDIISPAPTRGEPLSYRAGEEPTNRRPANTFVPSSGASRPSERPAGWVRPVAETPLRPTHVPGFDVRNVASRALGSEHIFINVADVQPGPGPSWHIHEFDQFYYVLQGALTVEIAHKRYEVRPHQLMVIPAGVPHRNWNNGAELERHIAIIQPEPPAGVKRDLEVNFALADASSATSS